MRKFALVKNVVQDFKDLLEGKTSPQPTLGEGVQSPEKVRVINSCVSTVKHLFSYSPINLFTSKKCAFTLAEVLITLGIIGIVAAMTMPSLIQNHQKKQTVVQLRKVYSDLSNAIKLSEVDNGPMSGWNYPTCASYNYSCIEPFLKTYYLPYFQGAKVVEKRVLNSQNYFMFADDGAGKDLSVITHYIILNNGTILAFFSNTNIGYIWLFADINGMKGPNKMGRDIFVFDAFCNSDINENGPIYRLKFWGGAVTNIENLKSRDGYACNKNNTAMYKNFNCGRVIELSGWEIPKDYPW